LSTDGYKRAGGNMETKIFNRRILVFLFAFALFLYFSIVFFSSEDRELGIAFLVISLFVLLGIFLTPLYFVFNKKEIKVIWLTLHTKTIPYREINAIIEKRWGETYKDLPKYEVFYLTKYKGRSITKQLDIPRNGKTKSMMERYLKSKIR